MRASVKKGGLAMAIEEATNMTLARFARVHNLSAVSLYQGYISDRAKSILEEAGVRLDEIEHMVAGGANGVKIVVNAGGDGV